MQALADGVMDAALLARLEATWDGRSAEQRSAAWMALRCVDRMSHPRGDSKLKNE